MVFLVPRIPSFERLSSSMCTVVDGLRFFVFLLQLSLHFKVRLAFSFDTLLFHISDDARMHGLGQVSEPSLCKIISWTYSLFRSLSPVDKSHNAHGAQNGTRESNLGRGRHDLWGDEEALEISYRARVMEGIEKYLFERRAAE